MQISQWYFKSSHTLVEFSFAVDSPLEGSDPEVLVVVASLFEFPS